MVGRTFRRMLRRAVGLRLSVRQLDEYCVLPDLYDVFYGNKQLLFGKPEPLTARNGYAGKAVFRKRDGDIAYSAQIFSVGQINDVLLFKLGKSELHTQNARNLFLLCNNICGRQ